MRDESSVRLFEVAIRSLLAKPAVIQKWLIGSPFCRVAQ